MGLNGLKRRINLGFWEFAHLPLPKGNIITYFSLRAKCWLRGGVGGQFPRNLKRLDCDTYQLWDWRLFRNKRCLQSGKHASEHLLNINKNNNNNNNNKQKNITGNKATLQFSVIEIIYREKGQGSGAWVGGEKRALPQHFPISKRASRLVTMTIA